MILDWTCYDATVKKLDPPIWRSSGTGIKKVKSFTDDCFVYTVRNKEIKVTTNSKSLSNISIPKFPFRNTRPGAIFWNGTWKRMCLVIFPMLPEFSRFKRTSEDLQGCLLVKAVRKEQTNGFIYLSFGMPFVRISTAYDSVTLYGRIRMSRPDIYGKIGNSGVSISCLDDAKKLFSGFDLLDPNTSFRWPSMARLRPWWVILWIPPSISNVSFISHERPGWGNRGKRSGDL